jgi:hypothetical protein
MSLEPFWDQIQETALRQGDYLPQCLVPGFGPDFAVSGTHEVTADEYIAMPWWWISVRSTVYLSIIL